MVKVQMDPQAVLGTRPVLLIGANVDDKPNFMTAGGCGVTSLEPPTMSVAMARGRYTFEGIRQNMTFSVNVPSTDWVKETDYCGLVSGSKLIKWRPASLRFFMVN